MVDGDHRHVSKLAIRIAASCAYLSDFPLARCWRQLQLPTADRIKRDETEISIILCEQCERTRPEIPFRKITVR
jgi:hypothetical protein